MHMHPDTFAVAVIAGEWFPYDRYDRWDRTEVYRSDRCRYDRCDRWSAVSKWSLNLFFSDRSDRSDRMETRLNLYMPWNVVC